MIWHFGINSAQFDSLVWNPILHCPRFQENVPANKLELVLKTPRPKSLKSYELNLKSYCRSHWNNRVHQSYKLLRITESSAASRGWKLTSEHGKWLYKITSSRFNKNRSKAYGTSNLFGTRFVQWNGWWCNMRQQIHFQLQNCFAASSQWTAYHQLWVETAIHAIKSDYKHSAARQKNELQQYWLPKF